MKYIHVQTPQLAPLSIIEEGYENTSHYVINHDTSETAKFDYSIIDMSKGMPITNADKTIGVVGYIPKITSPEWYNFYMNLCKVDMVAADSFNLKLLKKISFPKKELLINLDGISFPDFRIVGLSKEQFDALSADPDILEEDEEPDDAYQIVKVKVISEDERIINKLKSYIEYNAPQEIKRTLQIIDLSEEKADAIVSFDDIGTTLATKLATKYDFIWVPVNKYSYLLDSRHTHNYSHRFKNYIEMVGGAVDKVMSEGLIQFTEEFLSIYSHVVIGGDVFVNYNGQDLVNRIFHEVSRAR